MTGTTPSSELAAGTWVIDPSGSSIEFTVGHWVFGSVRGRFRDFSGDIDVTEGGAPSVSASVDIGSVDTGNPQRDSMIAKKAFFAIKDHPVATFTSTALRGVDGAYRLDGKFTLKGVTRPITLDLVFDGVGPRPGGGESARFQASVTLQRMDFGIDLPLPFQASGAMIGRRTKVELSIAAHR